MPPPIPVDAGLHSYQSKGNPVSVVVGPMEVRDISKAEELLAALRAVRDGALSEGRVSEYDVYVTNTTVTVGV